MQDYRLPSFPPMGRGPDGSPIGVDNLNKKKGYAKNLVVDKTGGGY